VKLARDRAADPLLIRDGAYHVRKKTLEGFCGAAFALTKDVRERGIQEEDMEKGIRTVSADEMIELLAGAEEVAGPF
jgi:sulfur transfer complex TusBCD TusB component (DsrH family)